MSRPEYAQRYLANKANKHKYFKHILSKIIRYKVIKYPKMLSRTEKQNKNEEVIRFFKVTSSWKNV